jgi:hypothetical protein
MAEIKVEKKNYTWLWVLLAIVVLGVIIYFVASDDTGDRDTRTSPGLNVSITEEAPNLAANYTTAAPFAI